MHTVLLIIAFLYAALWLFTLGVFAQFLIQRVRRSMRRKAIHAGPSSPQEEQHLQRAEV